MARREIVLQRTDTVRTEHRAFPNSHNLRVITKLRLQYKDSRRITITVVTSTLYTLRYTYIRTLICTSVHVVRTCTVLYVYLLLVEQALDQMAVFLAVTNRLADNYIQRTSRRGRQTELLNNFVTIVSIHASNEYGLFVIGYIDCISITIALVSS